MMALMSSAPLLATLTTLQKVGIVAGIVVGVGGLLFAAISAWLAVANERKRTQPIVMAHQEGGRRFGKRGGCFAVDTYLTNEGSGAAFNVRFGVEYHGVRFPYKHALEDHHTGSVYRVLGSGKRLPEERSWPIEVDASLLIGTHGDPDASSVFWARYENAQGKTWETRNPGNRSKRLGIKRVRARWLQEWWEQRRRLKAARTGADIEQAAVAELLSQLPPEQPTK
jgi:hypothetical protein